MTHADGQASKPSAHQVVQAALDKSGKQHCEIIHTKMALPRLHCLGFVLLPNSTVLNVGGWAVVAVVRLLLPRCGNWQKRGQAVAPDVIALLHLDAVGLSNFEQFTAAVKRKLVTVLRTLAVAPPYGTGSSACEQIVWRPPHFEGYESC